jgi:hypothetical protein
MGFDNAEPDIQIEKQIRSSAQSSADPMAVAERII